MFLTKANRPFALIGQFIKERSLPFFRENSKLLAQAIFTIFSIGLGIWFINHEHTELSEVKRVLFEADWRFVLAGILLTIVYISLQGFDVCCIICIYPAPYSADNCYCFISEAKSDQYLLACRWNFFTGFFYGRDRKEGYFKIANTFYFCGLWIRRHIICDRCGAVPIRNINDYANSRRSL